MVRAARDALSDRAVWFLVGLVVFCVLVVLIVVFKHDEEKPKSPQAVAAAAFNQIFSVREWKPGMGQKPLIYHPAAFDRLVWKPLPSRSVSSMAQGQGGYPYGAPMNQGGAQ